ncbi:MAG: hypothetical protein R2692_01755 [Microbacterium sp.]
MNIENTSPQNTTRPFGYWLRAADHLLARELETAFQAEGITRREGRLLRLLAGDVVSPELSERLQRHGGKKFRGLVERGWVAETDGTWTPTDEGRAVAARLDASVDGVRARVSSAVSDEDLATTLASLEAIARELGWNPDERMPRGAGRHGFGPGRRGFGPGHGFGPGAHAFGPRHGHGFGRDADGGHGHGGERAYERGFDAGFARGREAHSA